MRVEFRDVKKEYYGHRALDGLWLTAPAGEVYGRVGPNGAGKTTAMQHLAELRPAALRAAARGL